jgi:hypothetical protein
MRGCQRRAIPRSEANDIYILGFVMVPLLRETKGQPLPE